MTDVTIKNGSGVTFTFEDGEIETVSSDITAQPDVMPMPGSAPANTFIIDLGGAEKNISIKGVLIESASTRTDSGTVTTILQQKQWLEALIDGAQSTAQFTSNYESETYGGSSFTNTMVVVTRITFDENAGDPGRLPFTMSMKVGA